MVELAYTLVSKANILVGSNPTIDTAKGENMLSLKSITNEYMRDKLIPLSAKINESGGTLYVVGGAIRNHLFGMQSTDFDLVVVGLREDTLTELLSSYKKVGDSFPVFLWEDYEIAMARTEISTGKGHKGYKVFFGPRITLEEDAVRRDFTINTFYLDIFRDEFVCPIEEALDDYHDGVLAPVGEHFVDDPLRVFRAGRFLAEYHFLEPSVELFKMCKDFVLEEHLKALPAERVYDETNKAFRAEHTERYFGFLREVNALGSWFPEIDIMYFVEDRHNGTTWNHVMEMLSGYIHPITGWGILVHDIGKICTPPIEYPSHYGHENESELAERFLDRFNPSNALKRIALSCQKYHMKLHNLNTLRLGTIWDMMDDLDLSDVYHLGEVHSQDCKSSGRKSNTGKLIEFFYEYKETCRKITGEDVLEKHPEAEGKRIGDLLRQWRINEYRKHIY